LMKESEPLSFAVACFQQIGSPEDKSDEKRVISAENQKLIGQIAANRIIESAQKSPPYTEFAEFASSLMWMWNDYGKTENLEKYLQGRFSKNVLEVNEFLASYLSSVQSMESGIISRGGFERENYDEVAKVINPDIVFEHLKTIYGDELDEPYEFPPSDMAFEKRVAHQFSCVHKALKKSAESEST